MLRTLCTARAVEKYPGWEVQDGAVPSGMLDLRWLSQTKQPFKFERTFVFSLIKSAVTTVGSHAEEVVVHNLRIQGTR